MLAILILNLSAVVTETQGLHELRSEDKILTTFATHGECLEGARALFLASGLPEMKFDCLSRTNILVKGVCNVPKPPMPTEMEHTFEMKGNEYIHYETAWVPDVFPKCWKLGRDLIGVNNAVEGPQVHEPTPLDKEPVHE